MTVIRPNSISGVSSITTNGGDLSLFRSDGTTSDIIINNVTSGIITATSFVGSGTALTGIDASALSFGGSVKVQANASGAVVTGIITGDGSGLTGLPSGSEFNFGTTGITTTKNLGVNTTTVDNYETVGAANSFRGIYIGDGSLIFNSRLDNPNGYYIGTGRNALNAGPITLGSTMTLDGAWVIV